jgi:hypothetical protein
MSETGCASSDQDMALGRGAGRDPRSRLAAAVIPSRVPASGGQMRNRTRPGRGPCAVRV